MHTKLLGVLLVFGALTQMGCSMFGGGGSSKTPVSSPFADVGIFPAPPRVIETALEKPKLVITPFEVTTESAPDGLNKQAADALYGLLEGANRFDLSHRSAMNQLLKQTGALAAAREAGADYLAKGRITTFEVKPKPEENWINTAKNWVVNSKYDPTSSESRVAVRVTVELAFHRVETGQRREHQSFTFEHTATAEALGIELAGFAEGSQKQRLAISSESRSQLLRYALDKLIRKMLPNLDPLVMQWVF